MSLIQVFSEIAGKETDAKVLRQAFDAAESYAKQNHPLDPEWYDFAMYVQKQPWFKDPEMIQAISNEDRKQPGVWHMPQVFCEAMDVVKFTHNRLAAELYPKLPLVRQGYLGNICRYILDPKKTGRTIRVIYEDNAKYPDERLQIPDGYPQQPVQAVVQTEAILVAARFGIILFSHDAPIRERKKLCGFFFNRNSQYSLSEDELEKKGLVEKGEIPYKATV